MKTWRNIGWAAFCSAALFLGGCAGGPDKKSTGEVIDDTAIHTKATAALINDPVVSSRSINVDVNRGTVILNGAVNGEIEKQKAEDIVRGINGVRGVQNNLVVRK
jgi:osmotically-inducible protein OsmY